MSLADREHDIARFGVDVGEHPYEAWVHVSSLSISARMYSRAFIIISRLGHCS